jgi:deoxyribonuclease V
MNVQSPHPWNVTTAEARAIQEEIRARVSLRNRFGKLRYVAGADISVKHDRARAAIVVLRWDDLAVVDVALAERAVEFPYVPGLLTFREAPSILDACGRLAFDPDLFLFDGQGIAHPRRIGLASHLGVLLDRPSVGCAKTRFIGTYDEPADAAGSYTDLWDNGELIGAVVRTRDRVKPMFISPGHRIDLPTAIDIVLHCGGGYRLPEPTRLAHQAAAGRQLERLDELA